MIKLVEKVQSTDGSYKFLFQTAAGNHYETLYFKFSEDEGLTETPICCLSSQVGCAVGCVFCATGRLGFRENLSASDLMKTVAKILAQPEAAQAAPEVFTFMGMGEPLLNLDSLVKFYAMALDWLGGKCLSLSTIVFPKALAKLADSPADYDLFVSLHSPWEEQRRNLIPLTRQYDFNDFFQACDLYYRRKLLDRNKKIRFSYLLLPGANDSPADISGLARLLKNNLEADSYRVQLLLHNPVPGDGFGRTSVEEAVKIKGQLIEAGVDAYLSLSRGTDVGGGCGQFAGLRSPQPVSVAIGTMEQCG